MIEEIIKEIKFVKEGGSCFECCDYEEMVKDLKEKLEAFEKKTLEEERNRIWDYLNEYYAEHDASVSKEVANIIFDKFNASKEGIN